MTTTRNVLPALLAAILAACGGSTAAPGGTGRAAGTAPPSQNAARSSAPGGAVSVAEPCTLLTDAEIEQATGFKPTRKTPGKAPGELPVGCEWEGNPGETAWSIVLGVRSPGGRGIYDASLRTRLQAGEVLEDLGDAAVQVDEFSVEAIKDDTLISITYMEFPGRGAVPVALARMILAKV